MNQMSAPQNKIPELGDLFSVSLNTRYQADPVEVLRCLADSSQEHILLESAEVNSRTNLKSLLLIDPSLRLVCRGNDVEITACSANGEVLLPWIAEQLAANTSTNGSASIKVSIPNARQLRVTFTPANQQTTEDERLKQTSNMTPLRLLQQQLNNLTTQPFAIFLAGVFAYDLLATFEQLPDVPEGNNNCPDYQFYLAETLIVIDHQAQSTDIIGVVPGGKDFAARHQQICQRIGELMARLQQPQAVPATPNGTAGATEGATKAFDFSNYHSQPNRQEYAAIVETMKEHIRAGDIFQVVPAREFHQPCQSAIASYAALKESNPSPYMFYVKTLDFELFGASPESALKFSAATRQVELYPIAGTRPRARAADGSILADQDSRIELALRQDSKEMSEHMMLVDLARNDLARIATVGSRYVADLLKVDRYSHVMHLVSRVVATLRDDLDALDAYRACMNMGTLVGAPKVSAATLIRQAEQSRRGSYGGAVGYLTGTGDMDTCIVIRSAFVKNKQAIVQAGAGVVFDSDTQAEVRETEQKASAVMAAIEKANQQLEETA